VVPGTAQVQQLFPGEIQGQWGATGMFPITIWETLLALGIIAFVAFLFVVGLKYLDILPKAQADGAKHE
jgi:Ni/Fe-hydrogenase subunit HybB-like protein